ncbi:MAG: 3-phosphoglycerate dehydrogenase [Oscillospiraceae bacterium]|nr:3-phosphoglycerate dehydrogenase [Oscillospiraceae bacterium]
MADIKIINNLSQNGLDVLTNAGFAISEAEENPIGILMRSKIIHDYAFNPELLAISRSGVGVNNIPVERCTSEGIAVFNTPGANSNSVKELTISLMVLISRGVVDSMRWIDTLKGLGDDTIKERVESGKKAFVGPEIQGKTLGVIGLGAVGSKVANAALDLGMTVYGYDPYLSVEAAWKVSKDVQRIESLDELYPLCDYITLHPPLTPETKEMINAKAISKMRDGVRLINCARGGNVNEKDVLDAVDSGKIAYFASDFPSEATIGHKNVILTPHLGGSSEESEINCAVMAAQELVEYLKTGNVKNSVNLPTVSLERMGEARLCVIHRNVPRMINRFLDLIGDENINVEHMINKPSGDIAYTIIDTGSDISDHIRDEIAAMDEVMRVRIIK